MIFKIKKMFVFGLCSLLIGCASVSGIEKITSNIDYADGLSTKEAIALAQKFLLNHLEKKNFILSSAKKNWQFKNKDYTVIMFMSNQFMPFTENFEAQLGVCLYNKTGQVFYVGKTHVHVASSTIDSTEYEEKVLTPEIIDEKFSLFLSRGETSL